MKEIHSLGVHLQCSLTQKLLERFIVQDFFLKLNLQLSLSSYRLVEGGADLKLQLSNHSVFLVTSPILRPSKDTTLSHLISTNSWVIKKGLLMNNKGLSYHKGNLKRFRSPVPAVGTNPMYFLLYHSSS